MRSLRIVRPIIALAIALAPLAGSVLHGAVGERPNILVILADDLGYVDVGFQGCRDIPTPHLDALAASGVRCSEGYVSHPFCSPTRAGLLTGRYQQRFGHESNPTWLPENTIMGLPLTQRTLADHLSQFGYRTGAVGKWHLGAHPSFHPNRRGFQHYFGALGGGHIYLPGLTKGVEYMIPMDRNGQPEPLEGYITTLFGDEASSFIEKQDDRPWFLYLAFNAPHTPLQSTEALKERVASIADPARRDLAAVIVGMDDAIGKVLAALKATHQEENTLIFFMSDNGGPVTVSKCDNGPLRAGKGTLYEGGIRVPFLVAWPKRLPSGKNYAEPVISLDVFATVSKLAMQSSQTPSSTTSKEGGEGIDLLPWLAAPSPAPTHRHLFWRTNGGTNWAVRDHRWKLIRNGNQPVELYDLDADPSEKVDRASEQSAVVQELTAAYQAWNRNNIPPLFENPRNSKAEKKDKAK